MLRAESEAAPSAIDGSGGGSGVCEDDSTMLRFLSFADPELEKAYSVEADEANGEIARRFMLFVSAMIGLVTIIYFVAGFDFGLLFEISLIGTTVLTALTVLVSYKTEVGRKHQPILMATVAFFLFSVGVAAISKGMVQAAPGNLREPYTGALIPLCDPTMGPISAAALKNITIDPSSMNTVSFEESNGLYVGKVCFVLNEEGKAQVLETRTWMAGTYNFEEVKRHFWIGFMLWSIFGIGAVLLLSMRCLHATIAVAIPGILLYGGYAATALGLPLMAFFLNMCPALAAIILTPWKLECKDREIFLYKRQVARLLQAQAAHIINQSTEIRTKDSEVKTMKRKLHAAQKKITQVMAESDAVLRPYALAHDDIDFGENEKTPLGEGSFGTVYRAVLRSTVSVAVKTMRVSKINDRELAKFKSELLASVYNELFCSLILITPSS